MRREVSSGGVVFRKNAQNVEILMILDAYGRWTLPKGLVEAGETPEEAALREITEETGITGAVRQTLTPVHYHYRDRQGQLVSKTVHYFLVEAHRDTLQPQLSEIQEAAWMALDEAARRSGYDNNRELFVEVGRELEKYGE
ncbi:MAG: NUDIX hydrolase [Bacillota bacterium]